MHTCAAVVTIFFNNALDLEKAKKEARAWSSTLTISYCTYETRARPCAAKSANVSVGLSEASTISLYRVRMFSKLRRKIDRK